MDGCQEALTVGHGIPPNHAEHHCWIQKDLWPCLSMGASTPGPLHNPSGGCVQALAACG